MNFTAWFIYRPVATSLIMVAILLLGLEAFWLLPRSSLPEMDYPNIQVTSFYPGASPEVSASSMTAPLERQFGQMPGLALMTSSSSNGSSVINLQFNLNMNINLAEQEVQEAIHVASAYLPSLLPIPPVYKKVNPADAPIMTLALTSETLALSTLEDFAQTQMVPKISQLSGVGMVNISGGHRPAIRIQVNPMAIAAYGINLEDIRAAIEAENVNAAKGSFDGPQLSYTINNNDQLRHKEDYESIIIRHQNSSPVFLKDIAQISNGLENTYQAAWINEKPAIILNIQRQGGANVIEVASLIKKYLPMQFTDLTTTYSV